MKIAFRIMRVRILISACWFVVVLNGIASAEERSLFANPPNELVTRISNLARSYITEARLPDGSYVPPETPEELARPLLPFEETRFIVDTGLVSGMALWCALDWENGNFRPMMTWQRSRNKWSDKQLAYMGLLHGVSMATARDGVSKKGPCTVEHKSQLQSHIARQW